MASWHFGATMFTVITVLDSNSQIVSTYILTTMTLDRISPPCIPSASTTSATPCAASLAIGLVWALSLVTIIPVWMYVGLMPLSRRAGGLRPVAAQPPTATYWFTLYQFFLAFALPLAIICLVFLQDPAPHGHQRGSPAPPEPQAAINPFLYLILSETFKRQFLRAVKPLNREFRVVNPSTTNGGNVSLRLVPGGPQPPASQPHNEATRDGL
ncbi:unnamed protein product [Boreogadus saida]